MAKKRPLSPKQREVIDRVRRRLAEMEKSWAWLARESGRTENAGYQWNGYLSFPLERTVRQWTISLGVSMGWLLGDEDAEKVQTEQEREILQVLRKLPPEAFPGAVSLVKTYATSVAVAINKAAEKRK